MPYWVYILKSLRNGRYYIGSTDNPQCRIAEHNSGKCVYTSESCPFEMVFTQEYSTLAHARRIEYWLKKSKSRILIEKIIAERSITKKLW